MTWYHSEAPVAASSFSIPAAAGHRDAGPKNGSVKEVLKARGNELAKSSLQRAEER